MEKQQLIEIGQRLRQRRQELGLTREKMSESAQATMGSWRWVRPRCPLIRS